jgi:alkylated DNA nucleotide flippase Atl1
MSEQITVDQAHDRAENLAMELLACVGFINDGQGGIVGNISLAVAGGAFGLAAGRLMAAASDHSFEHWIRIVRGERALTRAEHFTEQ